MSSTPIVEEDTELECRVCRGGPDPPLRPLFSPCLCSGSIGLVHQDCLEAWLEHSHKETCELCKTKYTFDPEYAENVPEIIPTNILIHSGLKTILFQILPFIFRVLLAIILWLFVAPLYTSWIYKIWLRSDYFETIFIFAVFSENTFYKDPLSLFAVLFKDSTTGLVLMGVIAISCIVLVS